MGSGGSSELISMLLFFLLSSPSAPGVGTSEEGVKTVKSGHGVRVCSAGGGGDGGWSGQVAGAAGWADCASASGRDR